MIWIIAAVVGFFALVYYYFNHVCLHAKVFFKPTKQNLAIREALRFLDKPFYPLWW
jgi:hypothetical protein